MNATDSRPAIDAFGDHGPRLPGASRDASLHEQMYRYAEDLEQVIDQFDRLDRQHRDLRARHTRQHEQLAILENLVQGARELHLVTDRDGIVRNANPAAAMISPKLEGASLRDFVAGQSRQAFDGLLHRAASGAAGADEECELYVEGATGHRLILAVRAAATPADGEELAVHWLARDLTRLRENEFDSQIASVILRNAAEAVMITDVNGGILSVNPAFTRITGYAAEEVIGRTPSFLKSGRQDESFYARFWSALRETGRWEGEIYNRRKSGEIYPEWLTIMAVRDDRGQPLSFIAVFSDLSRVRSAEIRLAHLAYHDTLTGLPNRHLFDDRVGQAISAARRFGTGFAVFYLDLDHFKAINDGQGHQVGDQVLKTAASRLGESCRDIDTAARIGGDEFALLAPGLDRADDIEAFCKKLLTTLNAPIDIGDDRLFIGASIGCSRFPIDADDATALLNLADMSMYRAKRSGGNLLVLYGRDTGAGPVASARIERDIGFAIDRSELRLVYQPLVEVGSGSPTFGVEALLRWDSPQHGALLPADFIPVAERTGAIVAIGRWVLGEACRQLQAWRDAGLPVQAVSVNVSPRQLRDPGFVDSVREVLAATGLPPPALELEITEAEAMLHSEGAEGTRQAQGTLGRLREIGVRIAIDDFGTGFSNLARLRTLPIDRIKIDRSFVQEIEASHDALSISRCIIGMGRSLGVEVVAGGVETPGQSALLAEHGCTRHQGFAHARPMPPEAIPDWLAGSRGASPPEREPT